MALEYYKVKVLDQNQGGAERQYLLKIMDEGFTMLVGNRIKPHDYRVKDIGLICEMMNMEFIDSDPSTAEEYGMMINDIWKATVIDCA